MMIPTRRQSRSWPLLGRCLTFALALITAVVFAVVVVPPQKAAAAAPNRCTSSPPELSIASALGGDHSTFAVGSDGSLWAWGTNGYGQLGVGNYNDSSVPVHVSGLGALLAVSAGEDHALALKSDGTVWAWGYNAYGTLGDGTTITRTTPEQVAGLSNVVSVAAGEYDSFALKSDGTVWAWGWDDAGQLGDGATGVYRYVPVQVTALTGITAVAPDPHSTLVLKSDGTVWTMGNSSPPAQVAGLSSVTAIAANRFSGDAYWMALKSDGTVWTWGYNFFGELGNGTTTDSSTPVQVVNLANVTAIAAGTYFGMALKSDGTVWAWGTNGDGELGNTSASNPQTTPLQVSTIAGATAIVAGDSDAVALTSSGNVWDWGANWQGEIGNGTVGSNQTTPYQTSVTQPLPGSPTNLSAVAGNGLVYLTWNAPSSVVEQYVVTPYLN